MKQIYLRYASKWRPTIRKHGNKGKKTGFSRPDNWLTKRRKEAKDE